MTQSLRNPTSVYLELTARLSSNAKKWLLFPSLASAHDSRPQSLVASLVSPRPRPGATAFGGVGRVALRQR